MTSGSGSKQHIRVELTVPSAKSCRAPVAEPLVIEGEAVEVEISPEPAPVPDGPVTVPLSPVLDITASEPLRDSLLEASASGRKVVIDASAVERLSTPCIQVILAAGRSFKEQGLEYSLFSPSETFVSAFDDLGLFAALMEWKVET